MATIGRPRKPKSERLSKFLAVRLTKPEAKVLNGLADSWGMTVPQYVRFATNRAAEDQSAAAKALDSGMETFRIENINFHTREVLVQTYTKVDGKIRMVRSVEKLKKGVNILSQV